MTEAQSAPATAEGRLEEVKAFFNQGEFFRAYDLAAEALELFPGNAGLAHRAVLSLANAGATALALERYYEFGLNQRLADRLETDVRSLLARLKKDQAFAETGEARTALLRQGRALYEDAFRAATVAGDPEAYYPAINAATLALFAGDAGAAGRLAGDVLDLLTPRIASLDDVAADRYWVLATALECHLVRGDLTRRVGWSTRSSRQPAATTRRSPPPPGSLSASLRRRTSIPACLPHSRCRPSSTSSAICIRRPRRPMSPLCWRGCASARLTARSRPARKSCSLRRCSNTASP